MTGKRDGMTPLQAFRENASQFNAALSEARAQRALIVEYTDVTGQVNRRYWDGARYQDRKAFAYDKDGFSGTYRAKFNSRGQSQQQTE